MGIGEKIKEARTKAGLSQKKLADIVGVKQSAVAAWEGGRNQPDPSTTKAIAIACNATTDYLLSMPVNYPTLPDNIKDLAEQLASLAPSDRAVLEKVMAAMLARDGEKKKAVPTSQNG